jgi:hypothetical protein
MDTRGPTRDHRPTDSASPCRGDEPRPGAEPLTALARLLGRQAAREWLRSEDPSEDSAGSLGDARFPVGLFPRRVICGHPADRDLRVVEAGMQKPARRLI